MGAQNNILNILKYLKIGLRYAAPTPFQADSSSAEQYHSLLSDKHETKVDVVRMATMTSAHASMLSQLPRLQVSATPAYLHHACMLAPHLHDNCLHSAMQCSAHTHVTTAIQTSEALVPKLGMAKAM
mmetsp:Transcript_25201/g.54775  ORF Transcript_25201/g.54775 Transcript_25201/m.54775 type:complete len:127 (+) Transcript_25201:147-527(+)